MVTDTPAPLAPHDAARLTDFARACKAAARAVMLYPPGHPAITATLGRIAQITAPANLPAPLRITVLTNGLLLDGRSPTRADPAIGELAVLLHDHLIGEITVNPGGDAEAWRTFLLLVGRAPDAVRAEGGISRLWTTMAGRHVELREIDYTEVLRERSGGEAVAWEEAIASCLDGDSLTVSAEAFQGLLEIVGSEEKLSDLVKALDARARDSGRGVGHRTAALVRLLRGIVEHVTQHQPDQLETVLQNAAGAVGQLTPDMMVALLAHRDDAGSDASGIVTDVVSHMSDKTIAGFVARNALAEDASIERVAHAFHSLVRDSERRERLVALAHDEASGDTLLGTMPGFEDVWDQVAQKLITGYSDKPFVSEHYARELTNARVKAIDVEQVSDDPPERLSAWLGTVATSEMRRMDLTLVTDLLRIEQDSDRWATLMRPVVALIEDLLLVGDFDAAAELVAALVHETGTHAATNRRQTALIAIDVLVAGSMMRHIVSHLATIDDAQFERVKAMCVSIGEVLIRPLAEALSTEERSRPRQRLTSILIAFGAAGRREVERLKHSPNAAVRRTAIYLLREFGGSDALPELAGLLNDNEQGVQREAVRAILNIGTDQAYQVLERALTNGSAQSREAIMQSLGAVRDERAAPLFAYILQHVDHRGQLASIYLRAIEALGALKDPAGVPALKQALYRGEWYAPRRTATLRQAVAAALARIDTDEARGVLEEAARTGPRGVRQAARAHTGASRRAAGVTR
jgi:HEAT repeat protein